MTVKIVHSGGNGVSIAPPDSNPASDKTVKLPAANGTLLTTSSAPSFRNVIYNGACQIAQRGSSFASVTATGTFPVDRFVFHIGSLGTWTVSQDTDVPTGQGFVKSLKCDVTTADTNVGSGGYCRIDHRLEGQDLQRFCKGTANAKDFALSFWVKSPKTGTHIVELQDADNNRLISKAYTVSTADTWEKKELIISKDTTGAFDNDNAKSLTIAWWLAAGSDYTSGTLETSWVTPTNANRVVGQVNCADNTANNFYLTGVQLETGDVCSDFEYRSYGDDLRACQRYYFKETAVTNGFLSSCGFACNATFGIVHCDFPVPMRAAPTALEQTGTAGDYKLSRRTAATTCSSVPAFDFANTNHAHVLWYVSTGMVAGEGVFMRTTTTDVYLAWSSEL